MSNIDYYSVPSEDIFNDIKENAIKIWRTYDDTHGYASGKINRIENLINISGNDMYMVAMFDRDNETKLLSMVQPKTREWIVNKLDS